MRLMRNAPAAARREETLDPEDWATLKALSHRIVDDSVAYLRDIHERPSWRPMPDEVKAFFTGPMPRKPQELDHIYRDVTEKLMPYPMGNNHPRFWSWYMGAGNYTGALGDFLAAIQGSNLGGGNHAAALLDQQVVNWCKEIVGFPVSASGTLTNGGSEANFLALTVARNVKAGIDVREHGVAALEKPLRFYASDQVHSCHRKAVETLGLGNRALRRITTNKDFTIDITALRQAIAKDRAKGFKPACLIATAGTVNTGAIDDLHVLADLAQAEDLWFHVDGCIGALMAIAPENAFRVSGLERAHSLAFDPHKGLHAPFEAGCVLFKNAAAHRAAFAVTPEYLETMPRGLAAGAWLHEYGLQTSRGFRALKIWLALREHGVEKFGRLIDQAIAQAQYLSRRIAQEPRLELLSPATINILCFRYLPAQARPAEALKALNIEIMLRLQEQGIATLSDTTINGQHCLRVAISNHRTRSSDLNLLLSELLRVGAELTS